MHRMETEERKQAAAELRRLPAQHGPAAGIAGSRRVRTAEEEREHADFVSPEKREERREDGEKKKERLHKEKQKRLQDQKKKKLEDEQKAKDKRYADKTKKAREGVLGGGRVLGGAVGHGRRGLGDGGLLEAEEGFARPRRKRVGL